MWDVSGITGAAPVWIELMKWLHRYRSSMSPKAPPGLVRQRVEIAAQSPAASRRLPVKPGDSRQEWFIKGTEVPVVALAKTGADPRIVYPAPGTVVALDPDIPTEDQKIYFEARPGGSDLEWDLDGQCIGSAATLTPWSPQKGRHVLKLLDGGQRELDSVSFEVRGNI